MKKISILGVDLAKASFTVCGLDEKGSKLVGKDMKPASFRKYLATLEKTTVIFEACSGAHYWARAATELGHAAKLIAPQKVTGFRKNNKNDSNDALAICIAAQCPGMEFAAIKQTEHQDLQAVLRNRDRLMAKQTSIVNYIRGILAEYGVTVPVGINQIRSVLSEISNRSVKKEGEDYISKLTPVILEIVDDVQKEVLEILDAIGRMDKLISRLTSKNEDTKRLLSIPGVGPITAASVVSTLINPKDYKNGRQYAASLGLTPRHVQTGGKDSKPIMLGISKCGNAHMRKLLVQGALSALNSVKAKAKKNELALKQSTANEEPEPKKKDTQAKSRRKGDHPSRHRQKPKGVPSLLPKNREEWIMSLYEEKGTQKTAVALANKMARTIWAVLSTGQSYNPPTGYPAEGQEAHAA